MGDALRTLRADNPSPLTLDGTRTHLVGRERVVIIDPGPEQHTSAVADQVGGGASCVVLLTHDHPDHAEGAASLAERLGAPVRATSLGTLVDGDVIDTDAGELIAIATPGHTTDHVAFHWPAGATVFVGDLMLGGMDSALVAPPEGDLADYLDSLRRVRALGARRLIPTHGDPFDDADAAIGRYLAHRETRLEQVRARLAAGEATLNDVVDAVYGAALDPKLRGAARGAARAYLDYLVRSGRARSVGRERWAAV